MVLIPQNFETFKGYRLTLTWTDSDGRSEEKYEIPWSPTNNFRGCATAGQSFEKETFYIDSKQALSRTIRRLRAVKILRGNSYWSAYATNHRNQGLPTILRVGIHFFSLSHHL